MSWPLFFAPVVLLAEVVHLVIAERCIGGPTIRSGRDPRVGPQASKGLGWAWFAVAAIGIGYPGLTVFFAEMRVQALVMMLVTVVGFEVRRRTGLRWALVCLTVEGAVRIGLIAQMLVLQMIYGSPRLPGTGVTW